MPVVIKNLITSEISVEKSRFIALLFPLTNLEDFNMTLANIKRKYRDARHYTYAYRYQNTEKASDDGEPQNTAGLPLLNLLRHRDLVDTALFVVRYFGGKKLGAGRLLRTYVEAGTTVLKSAVFYEQIKGFYYVITTSISDYDRVKHILLATDNEIIKSDFLGESVEIHLKRSEKDSESFEKTYNIKSRIETVLLAEVKDE